MVCYLTDTNRSIHSIPAGTNIVCVSQSTHSDAENYANPDIFDPFRFVDMRDADGDGDGAFNRHQFVSTNPEFIAFGHGRHAWCDCPD